MEGFSRILSLFTLALVLGIYCEEKHHANNQEKHDSHGGHKKAPVHDTKHVHNKE